MRQSSWINALSSFCCLFANNSVSTHSCRNHMTLAELLLQLWPNETHFCWNQPQSDRLTREQTIWCSIVCDFSNLMTVVLDPSASSSVILFVLSCKQTCCNLRRACRQMRLLALDWYLCQSGLNSRRILGFPDDTMELWPHLGCGIKDEKEDLSVRKWR